VEAEGLIQPAVGGRIRWDGPHGSGAESEAAGGRTTFDHQLEAFVNALASGEPLPTEGADPVANMDTIDALYRAAGLSPRGRAGADPAA